MYADCSGHAQFGLKGSNILCWNSVKIDPPGRILISSRSLTRVMLRKIGFGILCKLSP